jgi:hypothetical protein
MRIVPSTGVRRVMPGTDPGEFSSIVIGAGFVTLVVVYFYLALMYLGNFSKSYTDGTYGG